MTTLAQISDLPTIPDAQITDADMVEILNMYGGAATSRRIPFTQLKAYLGIGVSIGGAVNVRAAPFNATGNGVTDDTAAFVAAVDAVVLAGGGTILCPAGTYILDWTASTNLGVPVRFLGVGAGATVLKFKNNGTQGIFKAAGTASSAMVSFEQLTLHGNRTNQGAGVLNLLQYANAPLSFVHVDFQSFTARAIYGVSLPFFRLHHFTVTDVAETTDAALAGGAGLAYLPTMTGPVDIAHGRFIQAPPTDARYAPFGIQIQGTAGQLLSGSIRDIYAERYGHKSAGANPVALIDIYNWGGDLSITGITSRSPTFCIAKVVNSPRVTVEAKVIGQDHNFAAPAVQVATGIHAVTGDFPDPDVLVKATGFTAGALVHFAGAAGSELKNPRAVVDARACLQAVLLDYCIGSRLTVVAENLTGTNSTTAHVYYAATCSGRHVLDGAWKGGATYPVYAAAAAAMDLTILPGTVSESAAAAFNHVSVNGIRTLDIDGLAMLGATPATAIFVNGATNARIRNCDAPSTAVLSYAGITSSHQQSGNTWNGIASAWNPPSLGAGARQTTTVALPDALVGDAVSVAFSLDLQGTELRGCVTAAGTVTVYHYNPTAGAIDLGAGSLSVRVSRG